MTSICMLRADCLTNAPEDEPSTGLDNCAGDALDPFQQVKLDMSTEEDLLTLEGFSMEQVLQNGTPLLASGGQVRLSHSTPDGHTAKIMLLGAVALHWTSLIQS